MTNFDKNMTFIDSAALLNVSQTGLQHFKKGFAVPVSNFSFLSFSGKDAKNFLHRMLTNEVSNLNENTARIGGYCTPQGRVTANFIYWENQGKIFFFLPQTQSDYLAKRLRMYVLRDDVKIEAPKFFSFGIGGENAEKILKKFFSEIPQNPYGKISSDNGALIRAADFLETPRYLWIIGKEKAPQIWKTVAEELPASDNAL